MNSDVDKQVAAQFTGNFMSAVDILNRGHVSVTISDVVAPNVERDQNGKGKLIDKTILSFEGKQKRFICGNLNLSLIVQQHGPKATLWPGKKILLTVTYLEKCFGHKNVPVLRVVPHEGAALTIGMRNNYGAEKNGNKPTGQPLDASE